MEAPITHIHHPEPLSEKLAVIQLTTTEIPEDALSPPGSPHAHHKGMDFSRPSSRASVSRSSRQVTRSTTRRTSSFMSTHRDKMSIELTAKAEGKFLALMDLMASASREASSLKEFWSRIVSEREVWIRERDELLVQIEEITETLERKESEGHHHHHEIGEKKKEIEVLMIELVAIRATVIEYKKKIEDRDCELEGIKAELLLIKDTELQFRSEYERCKTELESVQLKLVEITDERDHARSDCERHHSELRVVSRELIELKSRYTETLTKLETSRKELVILHDRIQAFVIERDEFLHEKDRLHEDLRKCRFRAEESSRELVEFQEKFAHVSRESVKFKEALRSVEVERDELTVTIEHKNREIKTRSAAWEECEERCAGITLKYEHIKREVILIKEKLRAIEIESITLQETVEKRTEELRLIVIERDQLKEDLHIEKTKLIDSHRSVLVLQESLRRTETSLSESRSEVHTLTERIVRLERERDSHAHKHTHVSGELTIITATLAALRLELAAACEARDCFRDECHSWKHKYEEIEETVTEHDDSTAEFRFEIESLRTMISEARAQKERAIEAEHRADRERDEWRNRYEEKCREMERFEEESRKVFQASHESHHSRSVVRRVVSGESC